MRAKRGGLLAWLLRDSITMRDELFQIIERLTAQAAAAGAGVGGIGFAFQPWNLHRHHVNQGKSRSIKAI